MICKRKGNRNRLPFCFFIMVVYFALALILNFANTAHDNVLPNDSTKVTGHKMTITEVLQKNTDKWMKISGVIGTGEGKSEGKPCIMIFTNVNSKRIRKKIPKTVDGYKVIFEETGDIKVQK